jgi:hypothetical protein
MLLLLLLVVVHLLLLLVVVLLLLPLPVLLVWAPACQPAALPWPELVHPE